MVTGFKLFQYDREKERKAIYRQFLRYWSLLRYSRFFEELKNDILSSRRVGIEPVLVTSEDEGRVVVQRVTKISRRDTDHSGTLNPPCSHAV